MTVPPVHCHRCGRRIASGWQIRFRRHWYCLACILDHLARRVVLPG